MVQVSLPVQSGLFSSLGSSSRNPSLLAWASRCSGIEGRQYRSLSNTYLEGVIDQSMNAESDEMDNHCWFP